MILKNNMLSEITPQRKYKVSRFYFEQILDQVPPETQDVEKRLSGDTGIGDGEFMFC